MSLPAAHELINLGHSRIAAKPCVMPARGKDQRILVLGDDAKAPAVLSKLLENGGVKTADSSQPAGDFGTALELFDAAILIDSQTKGTAPPLPDMSELEQLSHVLSDAGLGVLVLTDRPAAYSESSLRSVCLPTDSAPDVVRGVLTSLTQLRSSFSRMEHELADMRQLGRRVHRHFESLDHELRLAGRMQRDFLPREMPESGPIRFSTLFRPCSFVSGDLFDIFQIDATRIGFYLADVVGHGLAAGLLTMYIKNAIEATRSTARGFETASPVEVISCLNDQVISQSLPDSQFTTAWYGIIDSETLELTYSTGGHPRPLHVRADGTIAELEGSGSLLGIFPHQSFSDFSITLSPGDRVVLYSDGLENVLFTNEMPRKVHDGVKDMLRLPSDDLVAELANRLDMEPGGLSNADDVSAVILDVRA